MAIIFIDVAERRADPLERRAAAVALARAARAAPSGRAAASRAAPSARATTLAMRSGVDRLQHVVDRAFVERRDRVFVVGGDEHDVAAAGQRARDVDARRAPASGCRGTRRRAGARRSAPAPRSPFSASATIASSGHASASRAFSCARSIGSSSAMSAVGIGQARQAAASNGSDERRARAARRRSARA